MLTAIHYRALDFCSSERLIMELRFAAANQYDLAELPLPDGGTVFVPTWAVTCCLAEREEEEAKGA